MENSKKFHPIFIATKWKGTVLWLCSLLVVTSGPSIGQSLSIDERFQQANLQEYIYFLNKGVSADDVITPAVQSEFFKLKEHQPYTNNWIRFSIHNHTEYRQTLVFEGQSTYLYEIKMYHLEGGKLKLLGHSGHHVPFTERPIPHRTPAFPLMLPPQSEETFYAYVESPIAFQLPPMLLWSYPAFARSGYEQNLLYGFYIGVLGFVFILSVYLMFAFRKEKVYMYYSLYILSTLIFFLDLSGLGFEFVWRDWVLFGQGAALVSGNGAIISLLFFTKGFLRVELLAPLFGKLFRIMLCACLLNMTLSFIDFHLSPAYDWFMNFFFATNLALLTLFLIAAIAAIRMGFKPARLYLVAFCFYFVGLLVNSLRLQSLVSETWITQHALPLGNTFEIILLTLGLAYWFKNNMDEKQQLSIRVSQQQKELTDEKDRIAQDLHDNIGTQLTMIASGLTRLTKEPIVSLEKMERLHESMNSTMLELRDTIWAINKDEVTVEEMEDKINTLFWRLRQNNGSVNYQMKTVGVQGQQKLKPAQAINLFRVVQEAINNSHKHSVATEVIVSIKQNNKRLELIISDNGRGFSVDKVEQAEHYGLRNMKKRAEEIHADFSITSKVDSGTSITLQFDLLV